MKKILLVGNPNVGKSTVFNALTQSNQHTGNWIGKTVDVTKGYFNYMDEEFEIYDLPGTYSLNCHSVEEEVTRDAIYFEKYDLIVLVVNSSALERNLYLVLQILEITSNIVVCCNLIDEANYNGITVKKEELEECLDCSVVLTSARCNMGIDNLRIAIYDNILNNKESSFSIDYNSSIEDGINLISEELPKLNINKRYVARRLLLKDDIFNLKTDKINNYIEMVKQQLFTDNMIIEDVISDTISMRQKEISRKCLDVRKIKRKRNNFDLILTNKYTSIFIMVLFVMIIFFITIVLSNYPSDMLIYIFSKLEVFLVGFFDFLHVPYFIKSILIFGIYRCLSFVISVMLPPMVIFFPMFSILEDLGYLPRVAFNMDGIFDKCGSCGKQALTMMMGFGCNAVGVTSSRIIDSKKERLIAILTNNFVPCNGRFPIILTLISMMMMKRNSTILEALIFTLFIGLSLLMTFLVSFLLSKIILKGNRSSFTLELPNFRMPNIIETIIRCFKDKVLSILKKTIVVCIPTGIIIWLFSNISINHLSLLSYFSNLLDPLGSIMGLNGSILAGFILGFPANEIVIPIIAMIYTNTGVMVDNYNVLELYNLFVNNGWNIITLICTSIFTLFHFPCSTTVLTIYHEVKSVKLTLFSILLPTLCGIILCIFVNVIFRILIS